MVERVERIVERHAASPVEQIQVEAVGLQPAQARLAGGNRAAPGGVLGQHLADKEDLAAAIGKRFGDELFSCAISVHFRRVDDRHPEVDGHLQGRNLVGARLPPVAHIPRADPERRDGFSVWERNRSDASHIPL